MKLTIKVVYFADHVKVLALYPQYWDVGKSSKLYILNPKSQFFCILYKPIWKNPIDKNVQNISWEIGNFCWRSKRNSISKDWGKQSFKWKVNDSKVLFCEVFRNKFTKQKKVEDRRKQSFDWRVNASKVLFCEVFRNIFRYLQNVHKYVTA